MARYEDEEYGEYFIEPAQGYDIDDVIWNERSADPVAMELFNEAFFENNAEAYQQLIDYMWDNYEIDFEAAFDWEDFRSWYDAA